AVTIHHLQRTTTATGHAGQRVLGDDHRQTGFLGEKLVQIAQQGAATGQHQTALGDVRGEFRRGLLQRALDRLDDGRQGFLQRFEHFVGVEGEAARYALGQVATTHVDFADFATGEGGADFLLDAFGGGFTDQRAVVAAHVGDDGLVEAVATNAYRLGIDHT